MNTFEDVYKVLHAVEGLGLTRILFIDADDDNISFSVNCNDLFAPGDSDRVEILPDDIPLLEKCCELCIEAYGAELFACMKRQSSPCDGALRVIPKELHALFKAAYDNGVK